MPLRPRTCGALRCLSRTGPAVPRKCFRRIEKDGYNGKKYFPPMEERQEALNAVKAGTWRKFAHIAALKARAGGAGRHIQRPGAKRAGFKSHFSAAASHGRYRSQHMAFIHRRAGLWGFLLSQPRRGPECYLP